MKKLLVMAMLVAGCMADSEEEPAKLRLAAGASLSDAPECSVDGPPCAAGLQCAVVEFQDGSPAHCVDVAKVCERLVCERGSCAVLTSYPVQVRCVTTGSAGPGGDQPRSNGG